MGLTLWVAFDYAETVGRFQVERAVQSGFFLKTVAYNVGLDLFHLFLGDIEGLTEPSAHQLGVR